MLTSALGARIKTIRTASAARKKAKAKGESVGVSAVLDTRSKLALLVMALCLVFLTLMVVPETTFAVDNGSAADDVVVTEKCAYISNRAGDGTSSDPTQCLPAGRWGSLVGTIDTRSDPTNNPIKYISKQISQMGNFIVTSLMSFSQLCWAGAIGLTNFAVTFDIQESLFQSFDKVVAGMKDSLLSGSIPALFVFLAFLGIVGAGVFNVGQTKSAFKRLGLTLLCISLLTVTMGAAASEGTNAKTPTTGSPWWVSKTINDTVNKMTLSLDFDELSSNNPNLMATSVRNGYSDCRHYLQAMHNDYNNLENGSSSKSIVTVVNRLWEETALRSWVTMQYGSPSVSNGSSQKSADNAQRAYCHVLEAKANTDTDIQGNLTRRELDLAGHPISSQKSTYLFSTQGFIDPYNSKVHPTAKEATDFDTTIYLYRMAVFWETCSSKDGKVQAVPGWDVLIKNMGDSGSGKISDGTKSLRAAESKSTWSKITPKDSTYDTGVDGNNLLKADTVEDTTTVCETAIAGNTFNKAENHVALNDEGDGRKEKQDTNDSDAAALGWRFDFPNVSGSWSEANLQTTTDIDQRGVETSLNYMYGNYSVSQTSALGSVLAGVVNFVVWGLLALILIVSKLSLGCMGIFLVMALITAAFPFGENAKKAPVKWAKQCVNLSMTGCLITIIGGFATCICQGILNISSLSPGTFIYNLVNGCSSALALIVISMFFTKIVGIGNPFSLKAMASMAGSQAMANGIGPEGFSAVKGFATSLGSTLGAGRLLGIRGGRHGVRNGDSESGGRETSHGKHGGSSESSRVLGKAVATKQQSAEEKVAPTAGVEKFGTKEIEKPDKDEELLQRDPDKSVRASLAPAMLQNREEKRQLNAELNDPATRAAREDYLKERAQNRLLHGLSPESDEHWVKRKMAQQDITRKAVGAFKRAGTMGSAIIHSKPLRKYAKGAVKVGAGVAMMAFPPVALIGAGMALSGGKNLAGATIGSAVDEHKAVKRRIARDANNREFARRQAEKATQAQGQGGGGQSSGNAGNTNANTGTANANAGGTRTGAGTYNGGAGNTHTGNTHTGEAHTGDTNTTGDTTTDDNATGQTPDNGKPTGDPNGNTETTGTANSTGDTTANASNNNGEEPEPRRQRTSGRQQRWDKNTANSTASAKTEGTQA